MKLTLQQAKDQAAKEIGYENYEMAAMTLALANGFNQWRKLMQISDRAMTIYAEAKAKEFQIWLWENKYEPIYDGQTFMCRRTGLPKTITGLYETFKQSK